MSDFDPSSFIEDETKNFQEAITKIHNIFIRESRKLAENKKLEIQRNILSGQYTNAGISYSPSHEAYVRRKMRHGGPDVDLVFSGRLLYQSLLIRELEESDSEYSPELQGGYTLVVDDTVQIPITPHKDTDFVKAGKKASRQFIEKRTNKHDSTTKTGEFIPFTMSMLWAVIEDIWKKPIKRMVENKYALLGLTNPLIYNRIYKNIMRAHGLSTDDY